MGIAAIYDGYLFLRPRDGATQSKNLIDHFRALKELENNGFDQYQGHGSICYAFDYLETNSLKRDGPTHDTLLTSSFYDNAL
jgi:hypothetical protein